MKSRTDICKNFIRYGCVLGTLTGAAFAPLAWGDGGSPPASVKIPVVTVVQVEPTEMFDEITYPGRAVSRVNASVQSEIDGVVVAILRPIGQKVRAGTPLLKIKNTDPVYEYVPVVAASPVSGVVSVFEVSVGSMVKRGQVLASITDPGQIRIEAEMTAADLKFFAPGVTGTFQPVGTSSQNSEALTEVKVVGISPLVDPATGTATVELGAVEPKRRAIAIGTMGRLTFKVNRRQGLQVPEQALVYRGNDTLVRLIEGNKARLVQVKVTSTRRGNAEIASGMKQGDTVVVRSSLFVADGQEVTVQKSDVAKK